MLSVISGLCENVVLSVFSGNDRLVTFAEEVVGLYLSMCSVMGKS